MDQVTAGNTFLGVFCQFALLVGKEFALRNLGDIEHDFLATEKKHVPSQYRQVLWKHMYVYLSIESICLFVYPSIRPSIHLYIRTVYIYICTYIFMYTVCIHSMYTYIQHAGVSACMHVCLNVKQMTLILGQNGATAGMKSRINHTCLLYLGFM